MISDDVFSALAHPVRRQMLDQLLTGSHTVRELAMPHLMTAGAISQHLKILEGAGLVVRQVHGREHHLQLAPDGFAPALEWAEKYQLFWRDKLAAFDTYLRESDRDHDAD